MGERIIQSAKEITQLISAHRSGDEAAYDQAVELLYGELRALAHNQLSRLERGETMQTTALVNEAYIKLKEGSSQAVDRTHFLALAATSMRHILIDYARARSAAKRGSGLKPIELEENTAAVDAQAEELLRVDDALNALTAENKRLGDVFICKFFGGLDDHETAETLGLSKRTAQRDWMKARAFLSDMLSEQT